MAGSVLLLWAESYEFLQERLDPSVDLVPEALPLAEHLRRR